MVEEYRARRASVQSGVAFARCVRISERVISVGEALEAVLAWVPVLGTERVPLDAAAGRVAAEPVTSTRAVPAAANSAMDGFAVIGADVAAAGATLSIVGTVPAGTVRAAPLVGGTAVKIFTGSVMPPGADTVVRVEDTTTAGDGVTVTTSIAQGANVRHAGEDVSPGAVVARPGDVLGPADVGVLASVGCATVVVHRQPRVAVLSTGAELVEVDETPGPGQVVNSNAYALAAAVAEAGGVPRVLPFVRDGFEDIRAHLEDAARADVVLSTGGVSVGDYDFVKEALDALGVERAFWRVAQKPGKPLTFGRRGACVFFGLPGNPVSALVCFWIYAWPALRRLAGHERVHLPVVWASLGREIKKRAAPTEFIRVQLTDGAEGPVATPVRSQSSGVLTSLSRGAGLLIAPAGRVAIAAGERLPVVVPSATGLARAQPPPFDGVGSKPTSGGATQVAT
jgi:molybdopterin molybdotransferase